MFFIDFNYIFINTHKHIYIYIYINIYSLIERNNFVKLKINNNASYIYVVLIFIVDFTYKYYVLFNSNIVVFVVLKIF
jgi:hypothetical protein